MYRFRIPFKTTPGNYRCKGYTKHLGDTISYLDLSDLDNETNKLIEIEDLLDFDYKDKSINKNYLWNIISILQDIINAHTKDKDGYNAHTKDEDGYNVHTDTYIFTKEIETLPKIIYIIVKNKLTDNYYYDDEEEEIIEVLFDSLEIDYEKYNKKVTEYTTYYCYKYILDLYQIDYKFKDKRNFFRKKSEFDLIFDT